MVCFKETSNQLGRIINHLKKLGVYHKTDIYLYGDHGDSHYAFSEASGDITLQHATTPFHTTTHVPLIVKSNYLNKEERYDLVSHTDIYSTILNSLGIFLSLRQVIGRAQRLDVRAFLNQANVSYGLTHSLWRRRALTSHLSRISNLAREEHSTPGRSRLLIAPTQRQ